MPFVREYLQQRGVQFRVSSRGETHLQVQWAADRGVVRNATTGGIVGAGRTRIPFSRDDLYDDSHRKRIAPRLAHLPRPQTLALVRGLLESDGGVSRGAEIYFTSASQPLAEGLRYQCLRLGVPVSGQVREREHPQDAAGDARRDGLVPQADARVRPARSRRAGDRGARRAASRSPSATGSRSAAPSFRACAP